MFKIWLFLLNVIDLCMGVLLLAYGLYLMTHVNMQDSAVLIYWVIPLSVGFLCFFNAVISITGMNVQSCRCESFPSTHTRCAKDDVIVLSLSPPPAGN
jgi:hypothetical protein